MAKEDFYSKMKLSDYSYLMDEPVSSGTETQVSSENEEVKLAISQLIPFKNHPFEVDREDAEFLELVDSIKEEGIIYPILVRPNGIMYEIIAGHCRVEAAKMVGLKEVPVICRPMTDYAATVIMAHSNISGRTQIKISEKAKAYRMCMDAAKHQGKEGDDTAALIGNGTDSKRSVYRYIRLSYLSNELLKMVDNKQLSIGAAIELAYLDEESQEELFLFIEINGHIPSEAQAKRLRALYEEKKVSLTYDGSTAELLEEKVSKPVTKVTFKTKEIGSYFEEGTTAEEMSNVIIQLLTKYKNGEFADMLEEER